MSVLKGIFKDRIVCLECRSVAEPRVGNIGSCCAECGGRTDILPSQRNYDSDTLDLTWLVRISGDIHTWPRLEELSYKEQETLDTLIMRKELEHELAREREAASRAANYLVESKPIEPSINTSTTIADGEYRPVMTKEQFGQDESIKSLSRVIHEELHHWLIVEDNIKPLGISLLILSCIIAASVVF